MIDLDLLSKLVSFIGVLLALSLGYQVVEEKGEFVKNKMKYGKRMFLYIRRLKKAEGMCGTPR